MQNVNMEATLEFTHLGWCDPKFGVQKTQVRIFGLVAWKTKGQGCIGVLGAHVKAYDQLEVKIQISKLELQSQDNWRKNSF